MALWWPDRTRIAIADTCKADTLAAHDAGPGNTGEGRGGDQVMEEALLAFKGSNLFKRAGESAQSGMPMKAYLGSNRARILPYWNGRPLAASGGRLCLLSSQHPLLNSGPELETGPHAYVGRLDNVPVFVVEMCGDLEGGRLEDHDPFDSSVHTHPLLPEAATFRNLRGLMGGLSADEAEIAATGKALLHWHRSTRFCGRCGEATLATHNGWQRRCSGCGIDHFPRTNPVVIMLVEWNERLLVGRSHHWPVHMYSLLAGFVEPGETVEAAVRRETMEETGVKVGDVAYITSQPWPFALSLMLGCRALALGSRIRINPVEIEDAKWLDRSQVLSLLCLDMPSMRPPARGSIASYLMHNWVTDRLQ